MSSSTSGLLPPSPPTGVLPPAAFDSIVDIINDIEIEMDLIQFEPGYFLNQDNLDKLLYLSELINYWQDAYLVLYGKKL